MTLPGLIHPRSLQWWFNTDAGLVARLVLGAVIFTLLGVIDLLHNGRKAQRWREYAFLLSATLAGITYGVANDAITSSISWEYFFYGKGLDLVMPGQIPPDPTALRHAAMEIGCKAGGSAGILIGAVLLIANNPRVGRRRLSYPELSSILAAIYPITILCSALLGIAGARGWLLWTSHDLAALWQSGDYRPSHFLGVYGIHLGAYIGGAIGAGTALLRTEQKRRAILNG